MSGGEPTEEDALYDERYSYDMISVAEEEGPIDVATAAKYEWYREAEEDLKRYMQTLQQEEESIDDECEETGSPASSEKEVEAGDFLEQNRSCSYGGWEDDTLDQWAVEKVLKRSRKGGETYYQIKWLNHPDTTWETQEDLIEEGHEPYLNEFNAVKTIKKTVKATPRFKMHTFDPATFWPDYKDRIQTAFDNVGFTATKIFNICRGDLGEKFASKISTENVPVQLFHGTKGMFIDKIIEGGLKIPGRSGVRVVNGSAYGVGIYTGVTPSMSHYYASCTGYMFVCAGIVSGEYQTSVKRPGNMVVFFDDTLVLPCFLVAYTPHRSIPPVNAAVLPVSELRGSGDLPNAPLVASLSSGEKDKLAAFSYKLTKKQLRAAPRAAKEAYKNGECHQKRSSKRK